MEKNKPKKIKNKYNWEIFFVSTKERDFFTEHLAMMLASGMDVISSISILEEETNSYFFKKILKKLRIDLQDGSSLWRALEKTRLASTDVISLIRVGEESGKLKENLRTIVIQQRKERVFSSRLRSAMIYPVIVLSLTVTVGLGVAWFILPRLSTVFASLRIELPFMTRMLIKAGTFLGQHGSKVVPLTILGLVLLLYFLFFFKYTRIVGHWILLHAPGTGKMIKEIQIARFGFVLGTLLDSGLHVLESLKALARATNIYFYKDLYNKIQVSVADGMSIHDSLKAVKGSKKLISPFVQQMISAGEQSGRLSATLLTIGGIFEEKTETTTKNFSVILEPVLLVIVAVGVLGVAMAVILPIYSIIGGLQGNDPVASSTPPPPIEEAVVIQEEDINIGVATSTDLIISTSTEEILSTTTVKAKILVIPNNLGYLNVRKEPRVSADLLTTIKPGQEFDLVSEQNGWYEIKFTPIRTGWVSAKYVKKITE